MKLQFKLWITIPIGTTCFLTLKVLFFYHYFLPFDLLLLLLSLIFESEKSKNWGLDKCRSIEIQSPVGGCSSLVWTWHLEFHPWLVSLALISVTEFLCPPVHFLAPHCDLPCGYDRVNMFREDSLVLRASLPVRRGEVVLTELPREDHLLGLVLAQRCSGQDHFQPPFSTGRITIFLFVSWFILREPVWFFKVL